MAEVAESNVERLNLDGKILSEQLEGLGTIELVEPKSSAALKVSMHVAFRDVDADTQDRYYGTITSILSDTQIGLMFDRMAISNEVIVNHQNDAPPEISRAEQAARGDG